MLEVKKHNQNSSKVRGEIIGYFHKPQISRFLLQTVRDHAQPLSVPEGIWEEENEVGQVEKEVYGICKLPNVRVVFQFEK